jgi:hypothetical protein
MREEKDGLSTLEIILIILIIVIIILTYVITIGYVDILKKLEQKEELAIENGADEIANGIEIQGDTLAKDKEKLSKLKYRYSRVKEIITRSELINSKLNRRFKLIYGGVKMIMISLFIGFISILYFGFDIKELGEILTWIGAFATFTVVASFLAFGSFNGASDFINNIKLALEKRIRSKCSVIEKKLISYKKEEVMLSQAIIKQELLMSEFNISNTNDSSITNQGLL